MHDINRLAQNIRDFRCQRRMTQGELADKLFVTTQNVSKWERGKSAPDVENLCKLAAALQVSVDALLGYCVPSEEGKVLLAVDGGGTKTEFVLFTESGQVLERLTLGGSNPNSVGMEKTLETLSEGVEKMLAVRSDLAAFYAGVAGCTNLEHQRTIRTYMKKRFPGMGFDIQSDILNVMHSAECGEKCITVICGTGSIVYVRTGEGMHRLGGWGYLFDSAGSGYDLGRDAVCAALAQNDGIGPETRIKPLLEARLGGNVWAMVNRLYAMPKDQNRRAVVHRAAGVGRGRCGGRTDSAEEYGQAGLPYQQRRGEIRLRRGCDICGRPDGATGPAGKTALSENCTASQTGVCVASADLRRVHLLCQTVRTAEGRIRREFFHQLSEENRRGSTC